MVRSYQYIITPGKPDRQIGAAGGYPHLIWTRRKGPPYSVPGRRRKHCVDAGKRLNENKAAAGFPGNFRPLHGLRHVFASMPASSSEADLYTLQRLLHTSPR